MDNNILTYILNNETTKMVHDIIIIYVNICWKIAQNIVRNCSAYCSIYLDIVHIVHIARVTIYCTYCSTLFNICQYCSTYASIVLSFQSKVPAAAASMLATDSMLPTSMLPVPLTVLRYEFATAIHLLSTTAPGGGGGGSTGSTSTGSTSRFLRIVERCTSNWSLRTRCQQTTDGHTSYLVGTWHTQSPAPRTEHGLPNLQRLERRCHCQRKLASSCRNILEAAACKGSKGRHLGPCSINSQQ